MTGIKTKANVKTEAEKKADAVSTGESLHLSADTKEELAAYLRTLGEPAYRAEQLFTWLQRGATYDEMTNLPRALRERLAADSPSVMPQIARKLTSALDGTVKYVFRLFDGEYIESVVMRYHHGTTICISSQVGCRMGCRFCASTLTGRVRNLTADEMLGQVQAAGRDLGERMDGVVLMGIGEPLDNYEQVVRFLRLVSDPDGLSIGLRHISVSTCGLVEGIDRLADEGLAVTLSVSLHAPTDAQRTAIMPINAKYGVDALLAATVRYFEKTSRRVSFEYTLIDGENDTERDARALIALFRRIARGKMPVHVNLIPVNPVRERGFHPGSTSAVHRFAQTLEQNGITATVRRTLGADINASCGQLRAALEAENACAGETTSDPKTEIPEREEPT